MNHITRRLRGEAERETWLMAVCRWSTRLKGRCLHLRFKAIQPIETDVLSDQPSVGVEMAEPFASVDSPRQQAGCSVSDTPHAITNISWPKVPEGTPQMPITSPIILNIGRSPST